MIVYCRFLGCNLKVNLFGWNLNSPETNKSIGVVWQKFDGSYSSLQKLIFAVKPKDYESQSKFCDGA